MESITTTAEPAKAPKPQKAPTKRKAEALADDQEKEESDDDQEKEEEDKDEDEDEEDELTDEGDKTTPQWNALPAEVCQRRAVLQLFGLAGV